MNIVLSIPQDDWNEIVSLLESMCGVPRNEIEILQNIQHLVIAEDDYYLKD